MLRSELSIEDADAVVLGALRRLPNGANAHEVERDLLSVDETRLKSGQIEAALERLKDRGEALCEGPLDCRVYVAARRRSS